jgi:ATP-dependent Lhr-like helicase
VVGSFLVFAGRRWEVLSVSDEEKVIEVAPAKGGTVPGFDGSAGAVIHDRVRETMREILRGHAPIPFLDATGRALIEEARANYARLGLDKERIRQVGSHVEILLWRGDRTNDTLLLMLQARGFKGMNEGLYLRVEGATKDGINQTLREIVSSEEITPEVVAGAVQNKIREKWDLLLPAGLLDASFASSYVDVPGVGKALAELFLEG